jgi:hypothetical protein
MLLVWAAFTDRPEGCLEAGALRPCGGGEQGAGPHVRLLLRRRLLWRPHQAPEVIHGSVFLSGSARAPAPLGGHTVEYVHPGSVFLSGSHTVEYCFFGTVFLSGSPHSGILFFRYCFSFWLPTQWNTCIPVLYFFLAPTQRNTCTSVLSFFLAPHTVEYVHLGWLLWFRHLSKTCVLTLDGHARYIGHHGGANCTLNYINALRWMPHHVSCVYHRPTGVHHYSNE